MKNVNQKLSWNPISVLVPVIPDTSGRYTGHVRNTQNRSTDFLSLAIPDMSDSNTGHVERSEWLEGGGE
jgi:hypothetical protein